MDAASFNRAEFFQMISGVAFEKVCTTIPMDCLDFGISPVYCSKARPRPT